MAEGQHHGRPPYNCHKPADGGYGLDCQALTSEWRRASPPLPLIEALMTAGNDDSEELQPWLDTSSADGGKLAMASYHYSDGHPYLNDNEIR